jgi:hypothetical protein
MAFHDQEMGNSTTRGKFGPTRMNHESRVTNLRSNREI